MTLYDRIADRSLTIDSISLQQRKLEVSDDFARYTTTIQLEGDEHTGRGEDVIYEAEEQKRFLGYGADLDLEGSFTLDGFSQYLGEIDLFNGDPSKSQKPQNYRRWALESAALDLALKQAGECLETALDRTYSPLQFVVSPRLGEPPTTERLEAVTSRNPEARFKLDATTDWNQHFLDSVIEAGYPINVVDMKGLYEKEDVKQPADPELYRLVVENVPDAIIEDPKLTDETRPILEGAEDRISWDVPITGVTSLQDLPFEPQYINIKPSRFGSIASLLETIEHCLDQGIRMYGGGQFELGVGRSHLHAFASLFYPNGPNDVAPRVYNRKKLPSTVPHSPLVPVPDQTGLGLAYRDHA
jgi:hypothetical protein